MAWHEPHPDVAPPGLQVDQLQLAYAAAKAAEEKATFATGALGVCVGCRANPALGVMCMGRAAWRPLPFPSLPMCRPLQAAVFGFVCMAPAPADGDVAAQALPAGTKKPGAGAFAMATLSGLLSALRLLYKVRERRVLPCPVLSCVMKRM